MIKQWYFRHEGLVKTVNALCEIFLKRQIFLNMRVLNRVQLSVTPGTVVHQALPSMGFPRQECWGGLPFPSPGALPTQGLTLHLWHLLHWQADSLARVPTEKPFVNKINLNIDDES